MVSSIFAMSAFVGRNSQLIFNTAVILICLIKSQKSHADIPTPNPYYVGYKQSVLESINTVRRLHGVPEVDLHIVHSSDADRFAHGILIHNKFADRIYIPGENEKNPPESHFPLVRRMKMPNITKFARDREWNPIYDWYGTRRYYPGYYNKTTFLKYAFYTQLIWKESEIVMIGISVNTLSISLYELVLYVDFIPQGNIPGDSWDENVLPPKFRVPESVDIQILPTFKPRFNKYKSRLVTSINICRDLHEVPRVVINVEQSNHADTLANTLLELPDEPEDFPTDYFPLANRMWVPSLDLYAKELQYNPIYQWYATRKYYLGNYNRHSHYKYGYYTQLIWKSSREVTIGLQFRQATNGSYEMFMYINFNPIGNVPIEFHKNVFSPLHAVPPEIDPEYGLKPTHVPHLRPLKERILSSMNRARALHDVPPLEIDIKISNVADVDANHLLAGKAEDQALYYIPGENMKGREPEGYFHLVNRMSVGHMLLYADHPRWNPIVEWYSCRKYYQGFYDKTSHHKYGFYTQLIWKNSKTVAIGKAIKNLTDETYEVVLIVQFFPNGNLPDKWDENVLPIKKAVPGYFEPDPTHNPILLPYKRNILDSMNQVRKIHDSKEIYLDTWESEFSDINANNILEGKPLNGPEWYIEGETSVRKPDGYFHLINKMLVPDMSLYTVEQQYNPVLQWYTCRKYYLGFYDKDLHPKYGFYTQLIWNFTERVMIGNAFKKLQNGTYQVVSLLQFYPRGNAGNLTSKMWQENVPPHGFIPPEVDPNYVPQQNSLTTPYKGSLFHTINRVRDLHDAPRVNFHVESSLLNDEIAQNILSGKDEQRKYYIPGVNELDPPTGYFDLVHKLWVSDIDKLVTEIQYNIIFPWFGNKKYCLDHYDKQSHPKCGFYTQLIWKESKELGIGTAHKVNDDGSYDIVVFISFWPKGNNPDYWNENVLSLKHPIPENFYSEIII